MDAPYDRPEDQDALLSRLHLIEDRPLEERSTAYAQLHDELTAILEGRTPS